MAVVLLQGHVSGQLRQREAEHLQVFAVRDDLQQLVRHVHGEGTGAGGAVGSWWGGGGDQLEQCGADCREQDKPLQHSQFGLNGWYS